jgi:hypothetical protein
LEDHVRRGTSPPVSRGGKRPGAGRPPKEKHAVTKCFSLEQEHVDALERYRAELGLPTLSSALQRLIDAHLVRK